MQRIPSIQRYFRHSFLGKITNVFILDSDSLSFIWNKFLQREEEETSKQAMVVPETCVNARKQLPSSSLWMASHPTHSALRADKHILLASEKYFALSHLLPANHGEEVGKKRADKKKKNLSES
jgi:hypothetical protein